MPSRARGSWRLTGGALASAIALAGCGKGLDPLNASGLLAFDSALYSFSTSFAGSSSNVALTLRNVASLSATGLSAAGTGNAVFSYVGGAFPGTGGTCGSTLSPGASCSLVVSFLAPQSGTYLGALQVGYDGSRSAATGLSGYAVGGGGDSSFGTDGLVMTALTTHSNSVTAVAIQPDGKIIAVGAFGTSGTVSDSLVIRLNSDGSYDSTFDTDGYAVTPVAVNDGYLAVALQSDGRILAASRDGNDFYVSRYLTNGALDTTFGTGGIAFANPGGTDEVRSLAVDPQGRPVVVGYTFQGGRFSIAVARWTTGGVLDTGFDGDGMVITTVGSMQDTAYNIAIQTDGKPIIVGRRRFALLDFDMFVLRYLTDGSLDSSFGTGGFVATDLTTSVDDLQCITLQTDGKIVVGGTIPNPNDSSIVLRYTTDGVLDSTFNGTGYNVQHLAAASNQDRVNGIIVQPDGKVVTAGQAFVDGEYRFTMIRLLTDGSLDSLFGGVGYKITTIGVYDAAAQDLAIQSDGKFVVVGGGSLSFGKTDVTVYRVVP